jgi:hypothetical protein
MSASSGRFDHGKLSNPRVIGPGAWDTLHTLALYADQHDKKIYTGFIRFYADRFRCGECRQHFLEHLKKDPPEKYMDREYGMSHHSHDLHNKVNKFLGKPHLSWSDYMKLHINRGNVRDENGPGVCQEGCGDEPAHSKQNKNKKLIRPIVVNNRISEHNFNNIRELNKKDPSLVRIKTNKRFGNGHDYIKIAR